MDTSGRPEAVNAQRGECQACGHFRAQGVSLARAAYDAAMDVFRPRVTSLQVNKSKEEADAYGNAIVERDGARQMERETWSRRPVYRQVGYCGLHEFEGKYHVCEVKNLDQRCEDFTPRRAEPVAQACSSCRYNRRPFSRAALVMQRTVNKCDYLRQSLGSTFEAQAQSEYQQCVDGEGLLPSRPFLLPVCEARSPQAPEAGSFVVGPVVNVASRCDRWAAGENPSAARSEEQLAALEAHAQLAWDQLLNLERYPAAASGGSLDHDRPPNIEAHVLAQCLRELGADEVTVASTCSAFVQVLRGQNWDPDKYPPDFTPVGYATGEKVQPSVPFAAQPGAAYRHPRHPELSVALSADTTQLLVQLGTEQWPFVSNSLRGRGWVQLSVARGTLPVTVHVDLAPERISTYGVYVAWYEAP